MQTLRDIASLRAAIRDLRSTGGRIALVPTMGALHEGHMSLVRAAKARADHVIASIFVNPAQFGPNEDFDAYPRREEDDAAMLAAESIAVLWLPLVAEMYPNGFSTTVSVNGVSEGLCGAARPGHFDGVATVVAKLLNQIRPDLALFGEKDYQQLAIIRRMARDLDMNVEVVGVPIARAEDGLALSSRNAYLTAEERAAAAHLPKAMQAAVQALEAGEDAHVVLDITRAQLETAGFDPVDYVELCDAESLRPVRTLAAPARLLVAARLGRTRLIDNLPVSSRS